MDSTEQAEGERRVKALLVEPLKRRGLARPTSLTVAAFEDMLGDVCARLAYMSAPALMALEEQAASNPGGKDRDRFPIAVRILEWAAQIEPPADTASPLIRAVFAHAIGAEALARGWAPELLAEVKKTRRRPIPFVVRQVQERAAENARQLVLIEERLDAGRDVSGEELAWRDRRLAAVERCRAIAALGAGAERAAC
jgi:hypothetical protein